VTNIRIHRYEVPVDDQWHRIELTGPILHVGGRSVWMVEFWALTGIFHPGRADQFRVYGTGHRLPPGGWKYVGTVVHHELVWHLLTRRLRNVREVEEIDALAPPNERN